MEQRSEAEMVAADLGFVQEQVAAAAARAGRDPASITLLAVSKAQPLERVRAAVDAGHLDFGENYVQEFLGKREELDAPDLRWHFIGRLQGNKVRQVVGHVHCIHSVDRSRIAREVGKRSTAAGITTQVMIQINVGQETSKGGIHPRNAEEELGSIVEIPGIDVTGLMAIPPFLDPEQVRPYFVEMRRLRDRLVKSLGHPLPHLSMGMSSDFEVAIEEGATHVRVGSAIFGQRAVW